MIATLAQSAPLPPLPRVLPLGDTALTIELGWARDRGTSALVLAFDERIRDAMAGGRLPGVIECVPCFRSLTVHVDPLTTTPAEAAARLLPLVPREGVGHRPGRRWRLPACYDGDCAPDLADVAARTGLTPQDVIGLHTARRYDVYMLGFLPGFGFLGDVEPVLNLPRRAEPRTRVPAGSVAIAIGLTAIYPYESPGGWHLIGRSPVLLFDLRRPEPALFAPGDTVGFAPVDRSAYELLAAEARAGRLGPDALAEAP
ncbi:MAG: 5-oxoprolinase subunit PxpB [Alphaproteobacteria bacterium]